MLLHTDQQVNGLAHAKLEAVERVADRLATTARGGIYEILEGALGSEEDAVAALLELDATVNDVVASVHDNFKIRVGRQVLPELHKLVQGRQRQGADNLYARHQLSDTRYSRQDNSILGYPPRATPLNHQQQTHKLGSLTPMLQVGVNGQSHQLSSYGFQLSNDTAPGSTEQAAAMHQQHAVHISQPGYGMRVSEHIAAARSGAPVSSSVDTSRSPSFDLHLPWGGSNLQSQRSSTEQGYSVFSPLETSSFATSPVDYSQMDLLRPVLETSTPLLQSPQLTASPGGGLFSPLGGSSTPRTPPGEPVPHSYSPVVGSFPARRAVASEPPSVKPLPHSTLGSLDHFGTMIGTPASPQLMPPVAEQHYGHSQAASPRGPFSGSDFSRAVEPPASAATAASDVYTQSALYRPAELPLNSHRGLAAEPAAAGAVESEHEQARSTELADASATASYDASAGHEDLAAHGAGAAVAAEQPEEATESWEAPGMPAAASLASNARKPPLAPSPSTAKTVRAPAAADGAKAAASTTSVAGAKQAPALSMAAKLQQTGGTTPVVPPSPPRPASKPAVVKAPEMPVRFKLLPVSVQRRIYDMTKDNPVVVLKDFDEKVVGKISVLVDKFGEKECLAMLDRIEEVLRGKQGRLANGPGYLDVSVSTRIDELKQRASGQVTAPEDYARSTLHSKIYQELKDVIEGHQHLKWEHFDQGILNMLKKLPNNMALEKLSELAYHSFKNVDNIKSCIVSIFTTKPKYAKA